MFREAILSLVLVPSRLVAVSRVLGGWFDPPPPVSGGTPVVACSSALARSGVAAWEPLPTLGAPSSGFVGAVTADPSPRELEGERGCVDGVWWS